jgi:serine/threonine-protein kinase
MDEKVLVEELLTKACERGVISNTQKRFYLIRYGKGEISLQNLQAEISRSPSTRQYEQQLCPYRLIRSLGKGGMGEVFEAVHRETGQKVAIKKVRFSLLQDEEAQENMRKRFIRECSVQARLNHPNIVKVFDYGAYGRQLFLATELVEGETLYSIVEREKVACAHYYKNVAPQVLEKMEKICDAIHYAHQNNIIHRDINPKNIMIDKTQRILIMDFGLAKKTDASRLTKSNELLGTPSYMSPEQWNGYDITHLSDVYSLGATLFFTATGSHPYPQEASVAFYNMVHQIPPNPVHTYSRHLPEILDAVISKAMDFDHAKRYPSAQSLQEALSECLTQWQKMRSSLWRKIKEFCRALAK